jgi:hypothetical protein
MFDFVAMEAAARAALDGPSPAELRRAAVLAEVRESAPPASLRRRLARLALGFALRLDPEALAAGPRLRLEAVNVRD